LRGAKLRFQSDQFKDGLQIDARKFYGKRFSDPLVFIEYFLGNYQM
jgi:hypothetical protein